MPAWTSKNQVDARLLVTAAVIAITGEGKSARQSVILEYVSEVYGRELSPHVVNRARLGGFIKSKRDIGRYSRCSWVVTDEGKRAFMALQSLCFELCEVRL